MDAPEPTELLHHGIRRWSVPGAQVGLQLLVTSISCYTTRFGPGAADDLPRFENDVYVGLLLTATYLAVQRLRGAR